MIKTNVKKQREVDIKINIYNNINRAFGEGAPSSIFFKRKCKLNIPSISNLSKTI